VMLVLRPRVSIVSGKFFGNCGPYFRLEEIP